MKQSGRRSAAALAVVPQALEVMERPRPPSGLTSEQLEIWHSIVSQESADWFTAATVPLLAQYCRHVVHAGRVAMLLEQMVERIEDEGMDLVPDYDMLLRMQERESRNMSMLARSMRLTQQTSRHDKSRKTEVLKNPWSRGQQG